MSITVWDKIILGFLVLNMVLKFHYTCYTILRLEFYFGCAIYSRRSHKNFAEAKFFPGRREYRKNILYNSFLWPSWRMEWICHHRVLGWWPASFIWVVMAHFTRTWCWLTEGRSLQHYPELLQFYYNIHEFLQLLKDNKLSSSVFSPAVKVGGSCQEKWS